MFCFIEEIEKREDKCKAPADCKFSYESGFEFGDPRPEVDQPISIELIVFGFVMLIIVMNLSLCLLACMSFTSWYYNR